MGLLHNLPAGEGEAGGSCAGRRITTGEVNTPSIWSLSTCPEQLASWRCDLVAHTLGGESWSLPSQSFVPRLTCA